MKPTKNSVFCNGCQRSKMLFETKAKADKFIMYNSEGILEENGKAPVRSYYCEFCCGYHVTSNPSNEVGERLSNRDHQLMNQIHSSIIEGQVFDEQWLVLKNRLNKAKEKVFIGDFQEAEDLFQDFQIDTAVLRNLPLKKRSKYMLLRHDIEFLHNIIVKITSLLNNDQGEYNRLLNLENPAKQEKIILSAMQSVLVCRCIENRVHKVMELISESHVEEAQKAISEMREYMFEHENIKESAYKHCIQSVNKAEDKLKQKIKKLKEKEIKEPNKQATSSDADTVEENTGYPLTYKEQILSVIDRIEQINKAFNENDIDKCENHLEIAYFMLDELEDDDNKKLLQAQLDILSSKLKLFL